MKNTPHEEPGDRRHLPDRDELVLRLCLRARQLKEVGDNESARHALRELWPPESARPRTDGLGLPATAELLLVAGTLTSSVGWARQIRGAQARAEKLLAESARLFEQLGRRTWAAEAHAERASCLWRRGEHEAALRLLWKIIAAMEDGAEGLMAKAVILLRTAAYEEQFGHLAKALKLLKDSAPLIDSCDSPVLSGKFHNNLGIVLMRLGEEPGREDFLDQALIEFAAASFRFQQTGATRLLAHSENNHGLVLTLLGGYREAAERLGLAHDLFIKLGDEGSAAQVNESRARLLLAEGLCQEAGRVAAGAVRTLGASGWTSVLAEALITLGKALARTGRPTEACATLGRAMQIAEKVGARATAGEAALTAVEELREWLDPDEAIKLFEFAYSRLEDARHARARTLLRLSKVARGVYAPWRARSASPEAPRLWASARRLAASNSPALITGRHAEARRLLASYAHAQSGRLGRFVVIDCDAIEDDVPEPNFFERVAREAAGGTLFLDRVHQLSRRLQPVLLAFIRQRAAGHTPEAPQRECTGARVVAGTSCDLSREVASGCFDAELFEALGGRGPHHAPPADELEMLRLLSVCFDEETFGRYERPGAGLPEADEEEEWSVNFEESVKGLEVKLIRKALLIAEGHIGEAARLLNMKRQTLQGYIARYPELQGWRTPVIKRGRATVATDAGGKEQA